MNWIALIGVFVGALFTLDLILKAMLRNGVYSLNIYIAAAGWTMFAAKFIF